MVLEVQCATITPAEQVESINSKWHLYTVILHVGEITHYIPVYAPSEMLSSSTVLLINLQDQQVSAQRQCHLFLHQ